MSVNKLSISYLNSAYGYNAKVGLEYIVDNTGADTFAEAFERGGDISFFTVEGTEVFLHRNRIVLAEIYILPDAPEVPDGTDPDLPA